MNPPDDLRRENRGLRQRLALLSQASLSINESLDFDTVLQGVLDSARSLAGARYGVIALHDEAGGLRVRRTRAASPMTQAYSSLASGGMVAPCCDGAPAAHGVALRTACSVKVGAYSQTTFRMGRFSGLS